MPSTLRRYLSLKSFDTREESMDQSRLNWVLEVLMLRIAPLFFGYSPLVRLHAKAHSSMIGLVDHAFYDFPISVSIGV